MKTKYNTAVYEANKMFLILSLIFFPSAFLIVFIGRWINSLPFFVIAFIILMLSPYFFEKKIKAFFTKKVLLEFDELSFTMIKYNSSGEVIKKHVYLWAEIKSYTVFFTVNKNTKINIHLRKGVYKYWNFKDNKTSDEALACESLFNSFFTQVKEYNSKAAADKRIVFAPGFFATNSGQIVIYSEITLFIIAFCLHLFLHPKSSFLTLLMGFSFTSQQISMRKQSKRLFEKINSSE